MNYIEEEKEWKWVKGIPDAPSTHFFSQETKPLSADDTI